MTYIILNWLFGWDYVAWKKSADEGIARVHKDYDGKCWYWRYKIIKVADIIYTEDQVIWLTCEPSKYLVGQAKAQGVQP